MKSSKFKNERNRKVLGNHLENILIDKELLTTSHGKNIYFLDPQPSEEGVIDDFRLACSIESAGRFQLGFYERALGFKAVIELI